MAGHRVSLTAPAFDSRMSVPQQDRRAARRNGALCTDLIDSTGAGSGKGAANLRRSCSWRLS